MTCRFEMRDFISHLSGKNRIPGILFFLTLTSTIILSVSSCRKNKDDEATAVEQKSQQLPYFKNTGEIWSFHCRYNAGDEDEVNVYYKFTKLRDTIIYHAIDSFLGIVMSEEAERYGPNDTLRYFSTHTYYYDDDLRLLIRMDTNTTKILDFKYLEYKFKERIVCSNSGTEYTYLKSHEIEKKGKYHRNIFTNSDGQKIIEGITIQLSGCSYVAELNQISGAGSNLLSFEYASNEYYYKWVKE